MIKNADFIDPFDHEHSSPRVVLFRRETRRYRGGSAQHPLWHPATCSERPDREARGVAWHQAVSATTIRAFACRLGAIRVYQTVLRQRCDRRRKATPEQVAAIAHCRAIDRVARLYPRPAAEASNQVSRVSPLLARSSACRSREITPGPRYRTCDYPPREKTARWNPGSTVTQTAIDSTRPQKVQTRSCGRAMEAR